MSFAFSKLLPARFRNSWIHMHRRLASLEKQQAESQKLFDLLLADTVHSERCELGMHSQEKRRAVVMDLFVKLGLQQAVETGTFMGNTTNYLARTFKVPVYSSELVPSYHHTARRMLREVPDVHLHLEDSRTFLRGLAEQPEVISKPTLFYLDAHWYNDLPLADEIDIIAASWPQFAILVDDFRVPGDAGYAYDDYGPAKALDMDYLGPVLKRNGLIAFFPTTPSSQETGGRPGYVVVSSKVNAALIASCSLLSQHVEA